MHLKPPHPKELLLKLISHLYIRSYSGTLVVRTSMFPFGGARVDTNESKPWLRGKGGTLALSMLSGGGESGVEIQL